MVKNSPATGQAAGGAGQHGGQADTRTGDGPTETVLLVERCGPVTVFTLNRPHALNSLNARLVADLTGALADFEADPAQRVGVLAGKGRAFCAGMDLKEYADRGAPEGLDRLYKGLGAKPFIAAVEDLALAGGLELALACDLLVATRGARLGIPEVGVGLFAGGGGLLRLPRKMPALATLMALTGDPITGEVADRHGLLAAVAEPGHALDSAMAIANRIAQNSPDAVVASKFVLHQSVGMREEQFWEFQRPHLERILASSDAHEAARAFAENRPPRWTTG